MNLDNQKISVDTLRVVPILNLIESEGAVAVQVEAHARHGAPRIRLCFARSKKFIASLHRDELARHVGRSVGSDGEQSHYCAHLGGVDVLWFESDPLWLAKINRQGVTA